ncbi:1952_t:CDS:2 [Cetraspora pellucida]|uniref:1952_t:CDS:1 n=1 Tax=Cetraspora pellucida TaxID=1433469 RepID=A0A9N9CJ84_9GLOM|nr:1952_t:CDS:2 [Cetraspora pellucida]
MAKQFNNFFEETYIKNLLCSSFETDLTALSSNSHKFFSRNYNKIVVISMISFSNNYTIKDFISDFRQYQKVDLHENILKFIGIIKQKCWRYGSNLRPTIQQVFKNLNDIHYNYEEIITEIVKNKEHKEKPISSIENSNTTSLLQHYNDLQYELIKELEIISSVITTLKKALIKNPVNSLNLSINIPKKIPSIITNQLYDNNLLRFLFNLNNLFILQFNIQGISEITSSSIVQCIRNSIINNGKYPPEVFNLYYNNQFRFCFTGIIGFFYEYGIGTNVDYYKAFDMYKKAADEFRFTYSLNKNDYFLITDDLLKSNQFIGLISLGILYIYGKGVLVNKQKAFQLFLKSVVRGSILGQCYIGDCYHYGYGVNVDHSQSFDWYFKSAKDGNARAQNAIGYSYQLGEKILKSNSLAFSWFIKSVENELGFILCLEMSAAKKKPVN